MYVGRAASAVVVFVAAAATVVSAHGGHGDDGQGNQDTGHAILLQDDPTYTYAELHMAQEHHMDNFDIQAFFHLHDLNRDGILDVNELESIYGVHHEKRKSASGVPLEVHTQQAREIVQAVLEKLDTNKDGVLTMREFIAGGVGGLPNFKGVADLGHHYDAEGEYFLHHEEQYHNTPETQNEEDYIHPEGSQTELDTTSDRMLTLPPIPDIEHFMRHEALEMEEESRIREFIGDEEADLEGIGGDDVPSQDEPLLQDQTTTQQQQLQQQQQRQGQQANAGSNGRPRFDAIALERQARDKAEQAQKLLQRQEKVKERDEKIKQEELKMQERRDFAYKQAAKFSERSKEAKQRGEWGSNSFARPKDAADKLRRNVPYKFKMKKSWWGEF
ncbi:hypothetical protein OIV83_002531 [Microbotryomycetes sp. JL201]|nr:hypothetical protein OIV83_002531 [Microbotryomycetes sp. JL201]